MRMMGISFFLQSRIPQRVVVKWECRFCGLFLRFQGQIREEKGSMIFSAQAWTNTISRAFVRQGQLHVPYTSHAFATHFPCSFLEYWGLPWHVGPFSNDPTLCIRHCLTGHLGNHRHHTKRASGNISLPPRSKLPVAMGYGTQNASWIWGVETSRKVSHMMNVAIEFFSPTSKNDASPNLMKLVHDRFLGGTQGHPRNVPANIQESPDSPNVQSRALSYPAPDLWKV